VTHVAELYNFPGMKLFVFDADLGQLPGIEAGAQPRGDQPTFSETNGRSPGIGGNLPQNRGTSSVMNQIMHSLSTCFSLQH
jgi:hypothetical protein